MSNPGIKKRIVGSLPVRSVRNLSRHIYLPGFHGYSLYQVWQPFMAQLRRTSLVERASGISFNTFMAIPPTLIFIFTLVPYLPISKLFIRQLFGIIKDVVPGEKNNSVIIQFLSDFINRPRNGLLSFGLLLAIFFSSNAMMGILRAFDRNYPGFRKRKGLTKRKVALQLTFIVFLLSFICILLLVAQSAVLKWLGLGNPTIRSIIHNSRWVFLVLLIYYIISFIYRRGPALQKKWHFVSAGSIFATTLMIIATGAVSYWVNHFSNYNKLYGSISAVFILMSLIFANALAILMGFELNVTLDTLKAGRRTAPVIVEPVTGLLQPQKAAPIPVKNSLSQG